LKAIIRPSVERRLLPKTSPIIAESSSNSEMDKGTPSGPEAPLERKEEEEERRKGKRRGKKEER